MSRASQSSDLRAKLLSSYKPPVPPYQPPEHPLTPEAQHRLSNILKSHTILTRINFYLRNADELVTGMAAEVNDRLHYHTEQRKRAARRAADFPQDDEDEEKEEEELQQLKTNVDKMTDRMEESVRKIIDGKNSIGSIEEAIRTAQAASTVAASQAIPSSTQRRTRGADSQADNTQATASFEPTAPPATSAQEVPVPSLIFSKKLQTSKDSYYSLSLKTRYAQHNSYVAFKRIVHDARNPGDDAPPLPHHSTWFSSDGAPAPGVMMEGVTANEDDSDDDIAIAREKISTKCPLTLREFNHPVTSKKCPHSFEHTAILALIQANRGKIAQCPVPGCHQHLSAKDLQANPVLIRKIRRIQKSRLAQEDEDEEMEDDSQMPPRSSAVDIESDESGDEI